MSRTLIRPASRISTKFIAASLAVSVLFVSLAVYSVEAGRRALEESVGIESVEMARQFAQSVDRGIYSKLHEIIVISMGRSPISFLNQSNAEFDAMADVESYIDDQDTIWVSIPENETSAFMDEIIGNNLSVDLSVRLDEHYMQEHGVDVYGEILVTNKYGAIVAMTSRSTDYRQNDEVWWQTARDERHYVGELEYDDSSEIFGIPVCTSVYDNDGAFLGVIKAVIGAAEVVSEAQFESQIFETTEVDVLTPDLKLVYSTHAYTTFDDMSTMAYVQGIVGESGYYWATEGSRERIYAYSTSPGYIEYEGSTWIFLMSHDKEEVLGRTITLRTDILVVSTVLLVALVAVSLALSNSVAVPIMKLKQATRRMAQGHLHERVDIKNRDELGELASAFNNMVSELEGLYENLEDKVEERTKELETANAKLNILGSITRHDALNQLSVLRGWLSVIEETEGNEKTQQYFEKLKLSCDTLEAQLKFTGMYEKVGVTRPLWMDVKMSLDTSMPGVDLKGARLVNRLQGLEVYADPMFPRVLRNLAENAVKHGQKTSTITFTYKENSDGLVITIEDDGVGVPFDRKARLFNRERDRTTGRAGFGLYLSRAILSITDMTITEVGEPGKGARFEITVPKGRYHLLEFSYSAAEE